MLTVAYLFCVFPPSRCLMSTLSMIFCCCCWWWWWWWWWWSCVCYMMAAYLSWVRKLYFCDMLVFERLMELVIVGTYAKEILEEYSTFLWIWWHFFVDLNIIYIFLVDVVLLFIQVPSVAANVVGNCSVFVVWLSIMIGLENSLHLFALMFMFLWLKGNPCNVFFVSWLDF